MQVTNILNSVKSACGIPEQVTVYDSTISDLIYSCVDDMLSAGVPENMLIGIEYAIDNNEGEEGELYINPRVLTAIVNYVQGYRGPEISDSEWYIGQYRRILHKLMLEPEEGDA